MDRAGQVAIRAKFPNDILEGGFTTNPAGSVVYSIPLNPNYKLFVDVLLNPEYFRYLKGIVGQIEGTETYKVNCASCAMYTLGLLTTEEIAEETRVHQPTFGEQRRKRIADIQAAEGIAHVPKDRYQNVEYGRNDYEIFAKILRDYPTVSPPGGGAPVARDPAQVYSHTDLSIKLAANIGGTVYRYDPFHPATPINAQIEAAFIQALKFYVPSTATVGGAASSLLAMGYAAAGGAAAGGGPAGGAAAHVGAVAALQTPHSTILAYSSSNGGHYVALLNIENVLYLVDYQQQYIVPEPYILRTILRQSSHGPFTLFDTPGEKQYMGYNYFGLNDASTPADLLNALEATQFQIRINLVNLSVAGNTQLFHQAPRLSEGILNRVKLSKAITESELNRTNAKYAFNKVIREMVRTELVVIAQQKGLLDEFADDQIARGKVPAPAAGVSKSFFPSLLRPKQKFRLLSNALAEISNIPVVVANQIVENPKFHIEAVYAPRGLYPEAEVRQMINFAYRNRPPAEKEAALQADIKSVRESRLVELNGDLVILRERITDLAALALGDIFGVIPAQGALMPSLTGSVAPAANSPETRAAKDYLQATLRGPIALRNRAIADRITRRAANAAGAQALGFFGTKPFGGGTRKLRLV